MAVPVFAFSFVSWCLCGYFRSSKKQKLLNFPSILCIIIGMRNQSNINDARRKLNLNAVFWDLPKFKDEEYLRKFLKEQKGKVPYYWAMTRFLKYGRVVDTFKFFDIKEITDNLDKLLLPEDARKRWIRMGEVFG